MSLDMREPSRLRLLNPLRTTAIPVPPLTNPLSAASVTSSTPYTATPASAIQPYNPQEWIGAPLSTTSERMPGGYSHSLPRGLEAAADVTGAPPPYTPRTTHSRPISMNFEPTMVNTSAPRMPPTNLPNFPPPPNSRANSRERRFLPSLTRRRDDPPPQQALAPLIIPLITHDPNIPLSPPSARRAASTGAIDLPGNRMRSFTQARWEPGMPLPPPPPGPPPSASRSQSVASDDRNRPIVSPPTRRPPPSGVTALGPVPPTPANWVDETPGVASVMTSSAVPLPIPTGFDQGRSIGALGIVNNVSATSAATSSQVTESEGSSSSSGRTVQGSGTLMEKTIAQRRSELRTRPVQTPTSIEIPKTTTLTRSGATRTTPRSGKFGGETTPRTSEEPRSGDPYTGELRIDTSIPSSSRRIDKLIAQTPPVRPAVESRAGTPDVGSNGMLAAKHKAITQTADQFSHDTIERFQIFAMKEAAASSDGERVQLFADFIVNESRIRRERYSNAISIMGSEIFDLTRDLFRPMVMRRSSSVSRSDWTPESSMKSTSRDPALSSTPVSTAATSSSLPPSPGLQGADKWQTNGFMPSLSPILSMSIADSCDSRGRPASRWWDLPSQSQRDPQEIENPLSLSKRESKYMGVPKEAHVALQYTDHPPGSGSFDTGSSRGSGEYPNEKSALGDQTPQGNRFSVGSLLTVSQPGTPGGQTVDVSRLVTLPPPYPRHHPAVNNNHPDLAEIRTRVRTLSDMTEVTKTEETFAAESVRVRENLVKEQTEARKELVSNLQAMINSGELTYMDAGTIEKDHKEQERARTKEVNRKDFEDFQKKVVLPLNELLTQHIDSATELLNNLATDLFRAENTADLPQEEGDDRPELLEKLTLLKWIFEARETLHKALFDLLTARNDRYRNVVLAPYKATNNVEKIKSTEAFFVADSLNRQKAYAAEVRDRTLEFLSVVEANVMRGCEVQLNAFWDIAPPLTRVLDKVPSAPGALAGFRVVIPQSEYAENPAYYTHPMQYVFSLLLHAEKSTYQFIESQTNMLCLLHQIKEAAARAKATAYSAEATTVAASEGREAIEETERAEKVLEREMDMLNKDLKEKVRTVGDQWESGLGGVLRAVKERLGEFLLETGGWDEQLEEGWRAGEN